MKKIFLIIIFILMSAVVYSETTLEIAGAALDNSEQKYKLLMENVVNSKTPGYRELSAKVNSNTKGKITSETYYNFSQGDFTSTGRKFDFAIEGKGFFSVQTKEGVILYTRDGRFTLDQENRLVTYAGNYLLIGESGPIIIDESMEKVSITETGKILHGNVESDRIKIVDFSNPKVLRALTGSFFYVVSDEKQTEQQLADYHLRVGVIEGPNTNLSRQMVELPLVQKTYDANSRVIQFRLKSMSSSLEMGKVQ